jgi:hypothetical protein
MLRQGCGLVRGPDGAGPGGGAWGERSPGVGADWVESTTASRSLDSCGRRRGDLLHVESRAAMIRRLAIRSQRTEPALIWSMLQLRSSRGFASGGGGFMRGTPRAAAFSDVALNSRSSGVVSVRSAWNRRPKPHLRLERDGRSTRCRQRRNVESRQKLSSGRHGVIPKCKERREGNC